MTAPLVSDPDLDDEEHDEPAPFRPSRGFGVALTVGGAIGLAAAFTLAVDKYRILEDPTYQPSCNLNPVLSCGSVMITDQAQAFGFPNPLIGLVAFAIVVTIGVLPLYVLHDPVVAVRVMPNCAAPLT